MTFRGNKKWSYVDNSGQILGQPTMQMLMLNTSTAPFNNKKLRIALAKGGNAKQFSQEIDMGVNTPVTGLFLPGSPYFTKTTYPTYDPAGAKKLVSQVAQETGKPVAFTLNSTNDPEVERAAQYVKQQYGNIGITVNINIAAQSRADQQRPVRDVPGHGLAPVRRGRSRSELRVVEYQHGHSRAGPQHGSQLRSEDPGRAHRGAVDAGPGEAAAGVPADQRVPGPGPPLHLHRPQHLGRRRQSERAELRQPQDTSGSKALAFDEGVVWPTQIWVS